VATELYKIKSAPHVHGSPSDGKVAFTGAELFDVASGKTVAALGKSQGLKFPVKAGYSNLRAGNLLVTMYGSYDHYGQNAAFQLIDVSNPANPKVLPQISVLAYSKPRQPVMEKIAPELYALDGYCNNSVGFPYFAIACDTPMFVAGNRLYVRTTSHLYCIGETSGPGPAGTSAR
jgi:hypothetical protein